MAGFSNGIPAGVKNGNGKRERVDQEDDQEFMPLSKRINNIHLSPERLVNGSMHTNGHSGSVAHHSLSNGYNGVPTVSRHLNGSFSQHHQPNGFRGGHSVDVSDYSDSSGDGRGSFQSSSSPEHIINYQNPLGSEVPVMSFHPSNLVNSSNEYSNFQYRPVLNESANPHYYESNRTLFELYIERQMRTNQVPHPNVYGASNNHGV